MSQVGRLINSLRSPNVAFTIEWQKAHMAKSPFENGLIIGCRRDSGLGCGPKRAVAGWPILRSAAIATRPT